MQLLFFLSMNDDTWLKISFLEGQKQNVEKKAQALRCQPHDSRGLENVWNGAEGQEKSGWKAASCCRWEQTWPTPTGSRCRSCCRSTSGQRSWQAPPYLATVILEIRTSAQEQWDEAEVILEDYVEWHDWNHFLLRQKWNWAIFLFFSFFLITAVFH